MRRPLTSSLAVALVFACDAAAQGGDLAGVTMRVLDDLGDVDAVIIALDASRAENADGAEDRGAAGAPGAESSEREAATPPAPAAGDDARDERLHSPEDDERGEGRLDDFDVEVPAEPPA